ncbi:M20 family dipeptidase [bacterium]|nr:M20 family dipeptidase [bacterium]
MPSTATAKLNIRTVANQNPDHIIKNIAHWLQKKVPDYVSIVIDASDPYPAMKTDLSNAYLQKAVAILETVYDKKVIYHFSG